MIEESHILLTPAAGHFELVWRPEAKVSMFDAVLPPRLYVPSALASPATAPCAGRFELVWRPEAKVSVFDSGFMLGDGVWEGIRLHRGVLLFCRQAAAVGCYQIGTGRAAAVQREHLCSP